MWFHLRLLEQCNLKCKSCYANEHDRKQQMTFKVFKDVLSTIKDIQETDHKMSIIYLSGGEPLLHPHFLDFLDYCFSQFDRVSILSNGILIKKYIQNLLPYKEKICVQLSLDGDEETNDTIRGKGVYNKVIEALHLLEENKLKHWISYTVSQVNKHCYKSIINIGKDTNSLFNNVTPYIGDPQQMLDYYEWKEFKYNFEKYTRFVGLESAHGPNCCGFNYNCGSFFSGITVNPDGSVAGCARINDVMGHYSDMASFILQKPRSISETCMKNKWQEYSYFDTIRMME